MARMTLDEIIVLAGNLDVHERRSVSEEYCELVFFGKDVDRWHDVLVSALGEPRKPAGKAPTKGDLDITRSTGGIWINQILYEKDFGEQTIIAKIWPWSDASYMTLKMAVLLH
jgi:hypothetical protein